MSYPIIKKIKFLAFLILIQHAIYAQKAEPIKLFVKDARDSTYYSKQRELWHKEILKNKKSESNWYNYFLASRYSMRSIDWEISNKEMNNIFKEMNKAIPNSFTYNLTKGWHMGTWDKASIPYLEEAYRLNPDDPKVHNELIVRHEVFGNPEKRKEFSKKYYASNSISTGFMNYNYNVLASLEKNAVLFTTGDMDTYPLWLLQDALGFRTDVIVLNISLCGIDEYRERKLKEANINLSKAQIDSLHIGNEVNPPRRKHMEKNIARLIAENSDRPVYLGLTTAEQDVNKAVADNLYLVGLASHYSKERIDNIALLKKNYEQNFLLDYLKIDFYVDDSKRMVNWCNQNYVTPFISLLKHYRIAGETQKADQLKILLKKIAVECNREKEILDFIK